MLLWKLPGADVADLPRILVVDDSRLVRASLSHHLKGVYDVREEVDGEAAWQTLVLDHSIQAVISDLQMPKLDGVQLLERVRASRLRRLQQIPFILVSGEESEDERARASSLGVSDFIGKGAGSAEILLRLNHLLALSSARESLDASRDSLVQNPESGFFTRKYLELQIAQALSHSARHGVDMSVMVLGFDGYQEIADRFGEDVAGQIGLRFAGMLAGKMRQEDSLGHFEAGQFAIVSPGTSAAFCTAFAERVRQAVEVARLAVRGENIALTVSIGLAGVPMDRVASAGAMLDLAAQRMQEAMKAGGNRLASLGDMVSAPSTISIQHALELLAAGRHGAVRPHLAELGGQLLPLLQLMNKEFDLALPMAGIEQCFSERAAKKQ